MILPKIVFQFIFSIILYFVVENLKWDIEGDYWNVDCRQLFDLSNRGKTIKKKSGGNAWMRLNNEVRINLKYEMKVRVKSSKIESKYGKLVKMPKRSGHN